MARRRHTPEQIIPKLREADRLLNEGADVAAVARHLEISEQTYHRWRNQFGGMKADDVKRLKELEAENGRRSGDPGAHAVRQRWGEGFVTAVHLQLDLITGEYVLGSAGHPPAVKFDAANGTWQVSSAKGVVLGVVPELRREPERGLLRRGDALSLYTDGLVEAPGRDLDEGLNRLLGGGGTARTTGISRGRATARGDRVGVEGRRLRARRHLPHLGSRAARYACCSPTTDGAATPDLVVMA
jgi:hypothetical protein